MNSDALMVTFLVTALVTAFLATMALPVINFAQHIVKYAPEMVNVIVASMAGVEITVNEKVVPGLIRIVPDTVSACQLVRVRVIRAGLVSHRGFVLFEI